jgi:hypothetical protein
MVPSTFTQTEIVQAREFIISRIGEARLRGGRILGDPFLTYGELSKYLGYEIECESDGDRMGIPTGEASRMEKALGGPLISSVVVDRMNKKPGRGFWVLGIELQMFPDRAINPDGIEELNFWYQQVMASVRKYGRR